MDAEIVNARLRLTVDAILRKDVIAAQKRAIEAAQQGNGLEDNRSKKLQKRVWSLLKNRDQSVIFYR